MVRCKPRCVQPVVAGLLSREPRSPPRLQSRVPTPPPRPHARREVEGEAGALTPRSCRGCSAATSARSWPRPLRGASCASLAAPPPCATWRACITPGLGGERRVVERIVHQPVAPRAERRGPTQLAQLSLGVSAGTIRDDTLALLRLLDAQIRSADQELARRALPAFSTTSTSVKHPHRSCGPGRSNAATGFPPQPPQSGHCAGTMSVCAAPGVTVSSIDLRRCLYPA